MKIPLIELVSIDQVITFIDEIDCNKSSSRDIPAKTKDCKRRNRRANSKMYK